MAIKPSHILGMNSRYTYTKLNPDEARSYGFSKLKTKQLLAKHNIPTAQLYHVFETLNDLEHVNWSSMPCPFVIKPASGSAGKGIILLTKKLKNVNQWQDNNGETLTEDDFNLHVANILDGEYSTWGSNHRAIVEEMIPSHPTLAALSHNGTPDVRVIVFNSVPVMAMVRLPTEKSQGKANLELGAVGLGIDMATGVTTYGILGKGKYIKKIPGTKKKANGIRLPHWQALLTAAVKAANAAGYVFMGADLFIHPKKGPMIVEINGFPGLSIQLANKAGLKRRIQRVEGLVVRNAEHGVRIAQALFAESFSDQVIADEGLTIISNRPGIEVKDDRGKKHPVVAMVNTGRFRSAISRNLAEELGLVNFEDLLWQQQVAVEGKVPVVEVEFVIKERAIKTAMLVTKKLDRKSHKVELGRRDMKGFLIGEIDE